MATRALVVLLSLGLALACGGTSEPSNPVGSFHFSVTGSGGTSLVTGDSAVWVTTPRGLFNGQFVALSAQSPLPDTLLVLIVTTDGSLAGGPLRPGSYDFAPSDPAHLGLLIDGSGFQALPDSGTLTVQTPRADTLFEGRLDAWLTDTAPSAATYHLQGRFSAVPFR